ncbi:MAG: RimK/LysX family protein [Candidatus Saccharibacteria bacterium]|nr:RimK/LysX family protein [Candidatus Saccharibacteria bacterium]
MTDKDIIGRDVLVDFGEEIKGVPAKVDTGADSSAVWASDIFVDKDNILHFKLFDKKSKYYTGIEHTTDKFSVAVTKSSLGETTMKYRAKLVITIAGHTIKTSFGLSDRSTHNYPILIGRRTLSGKFLVDVSQSDDLIKIKKNTPVGLNDKMKENPYKFYKENYENRNSL